MSGCDAESECSGRLVKGGRGPPALVLRAFCLLGRLLGSSAGDKREWMCLCSPRFVLAQFVRDLFSPAKVNVVEAGPGISCVCSHAFFFFTCL